MARQKDQKAQIIKLQKLVIKLQKREKATREKLRVALQAVTSAVDKFKKQVSLKSIKSTKKKAKQKPKVHHKKV